jgi:hypothetical protein
VDEFTANMLKFCPEDARGLYCEFPGDPQEAKSQAWRAKAITPSARFNPQNNIFFCVSAMGPNARREYRRRKENFCGGLLLMIDDLGTGPGAKFDLSIVEKLPPTALIETSPDNHQAIYMFDRLVESADEFDALIKAFIAADFLGKDPGMAGINRVFRPPFGSNGKARCAGWKVRIAAADYTKRYSPQQLIDAFRLKLPVQRNPVPRGATVNHSMAIRAFLATRQTLRSAGMMKRESADLAGWTEIRCPWVHNHTGRKDNGAAIREPHADNGWFGAFKCHHGSCADKGWRELSEFIAQQAEEILAIINLDSPSSLQDLIDG